MDEQFLADLARHLEAELPDALQRIQQFQQDEEFREMCTEYEDGVKCLLRFRGEQSKRVEEYTELMEELQQEILRFLLEH